MVGMVRISLTLCQPGDGYLDKCPHTFYQHFIISDSVSHWNNGNRCWWKCLWTQATRFSLSSWSHPGHSSLSFRSAYHYSTPICPGYWDELPVLCRQSWGACTPQTRPMGGFQTWFSTVSLGMTSQLPNVLYQFAAKDVRCRAIQHLFYTEDMNKLLTALYYLQI